MKQKLFGMVLRKMSFLRDQMVRLSTARTLFLALFMLLGMSSAWADDVASVTFGGTTTNYSNFDDAIAAANSASSNSSNQATIALLQNCSAGSTVTINEGKYITISGGSYTLTAPSFTVNGNLTIENGTYNASSKDYSYLFKIAESSSSLTMDGGVIDATTKSVDRAIWADYGTCVINDGTIKGSNYGLWVVYTSVTLNGGTFYGANGGIFSYTTSKDVSSFLGDLKKYYTLDNNEWKEYEASGSSIDCTVKVDTYVVDASVTFDGTTTYYSTFDDAIAAANSASSTSSNQASIVLLQNCSAGSDVTIDEGKYITISGGSYTLTAPSFTINGNLTIQDGTYNASSTSNNYFFKTTANYPNYSTLTVNGGTIDATTSSVERAIWADYGKCVINNGTIKGNKYGFYVQYYANVTLNKATINATYSVANYLSDQSMGNFSFDDESRFYVSRLLGEGKKYYVKGKNGWEACDYATSVRSIDYPVFVTSETNVAKIKVGETETIYDSFNDALAAAKKAGTATVTLLSNCSTGTEVILSDINITLSGGSYTLTTSEGFSVWGNLTINDGTYVSTTTGTVSCINVQEGGSLTLNGGTFSGTKGSIHLSGNTVLSALTDGKMYYDGDDLCKEDLLSTDINSQVTVKDASSYAAVVYTGTGNVGYEEFASALYNTQQFTTASNPCKIILLKDCSTAGFEAPADKGFAIYANKHTLTLTDKIQVRGDLIIGDGTFKADSWEPSDADNTDELFDVTGTLTINGGEIDANYILPKAIEADGSGGVKLNGGTVKGAKQYALYINNASTGTVLSGGSLSANNAAIHLPSAMPVCYLLGNNTTFQDYQDNFFANESNPSVNIVAGDILYKRSNVTSGNYGSICLPYASKLWTGVEKVYEVTEVSASSVTISEVTTMVAGTPYLFKSNESSICFNLNGAKVTTPVENKYLVGNYNVAEVPAGNYVLQSNQFCKVDADGTIKSGSYRCYLNGNKVPSGVKVVMPVIDDDDPPLSDLGEDEVPLSIGEVMNALSSSNTVIYDLNGRRLQSLQKGVNIVNGKKVIVK